MELENLWGKKRDVGLSGVRKENLGFGSLAKTGNVVFQRRCVFDWKLTLGLELRLTSQDMMWCLDNGQDL